MYKKSQFKFLFILIVIFFANSVFSSDLGVIGPIYSIAEEDLLDWIHQRLLELQSKGSKVFSSSFWMQKVKQNIDRPKPVPSLTRTRHYRKSFFDTSIKVTQDFKDNFGHPLVKAGTQFNPLAVVSLRKALLFYDADDAIQVQWVSKMDRYLKGNDKLILVNGSVGDQMHRFSRMVYFDQYGRLVHRFSIHCVPAMVSQDQLRLKIEEFTP